MKRIWILAILSISLFLLACLKADEFQHLKKYQSFELPPKIEFIENKKSKLSPPDKEIFQIWISILTGDSRKIKKDIKLMYSNLALNHIFSPSGFHLSATTGPLFKVKIFRHFKFHLLILLGIIFCFISGFLALKRMILIKLMKTLINPIWGFSTGMLIDFVFGTFSKSALSFTYSFLFLGIVYARLTKFQLIVSLYLGQIIICFFAGTKISLLILFWSPILNFIFCFIMPILFFLSFPMWNWQLDLGINLLTYFNQLLFIANKTLLLFPWTRIEIELLFIIAFIFFRKWKWVLVSLLIMSSNIGPSFKKINFGTKYETNFRDFNCKNFLIGGYWKRNCSPRRRSKSN